VGAGSSVGAIDQPIVRERHTGFPVIPGSSLKGVLRDTAKRSAGSDADATARVNAIFGDEITTKSTTFSAGKVAFGEAKILAFPVRSAKGSFAFATCPLALERLKRDQSLRKKKPFDMLAVPAAPEGEMTCLAGDKVTLSTSGQTGVVLEEYRFSRSGAFPADWETALLELLDDPVWKAGKGRFALLSDGDFSHFVKTACEVSQHVAIDFEKGTAKAGALFNLEAVPAEAFFFAPVTSLARANGEMAQLADFLAEKPVLQFGGDGTTGLGFCTIKLD
jgi:CRISPR-associated protein Cmr4